ncbi:relaxase/mobilization nuclease domain-containing protein [Glutamicibacter creatinolyticus]|uniref:relaxase/mobilization nuclease domain-containing protein n=1 Tax=Glutamicibacter creatinolyticus TaxID=162496 RepID=UPI0031D235A3
MIPNVTRGGRMAGLMNYLVGPGRANEHENQRLIAGDDRVTFAYAPGTVLSKYDAFEIAELLDAPRKIHGTEVSKPVYAKDEDTGLFLTDENGKKIRVGSKDAQVWHCSLAVDAGHGTVPDEQWEKIAHAFVEKMGFVDPDGAKSSRWAAVHHGASKNGNDHIHLVVSMVREDGTKANTHNDFHRAQVACRELEVEYGLPRLESQEYGQGLAGEKPAERARAERNNMAVSEKFELQRRLRAALASANSAEEYLRHAQDHGVHIAPSFQKGSNTEVRGYRVSMGHGKADGKAIWYAPSKIDRTLGWPDINQRFGAAGKPAADAYLVSLHSSNNPALKPRTKGHALSVAQLERMMSHKTGPDTLANIYARLSLQFERNKPGALHELSMSYARATQGIGNARYAARLNQRFAAGNGRGWVAVAKQAGRLGRLMLENNLRQDRPRFTAGVDRLINDAEKIVRAEMRKIEQEQARTVPPVHGLAGIGVDTKPRDTGYER